LGDHGAAVFDGDTLDTNLVLRGDPTVYNPRLGKKCIVTGLRFMGLEAVLSKSNDVLVKGKKISGSASRFSPNEFFVFAANVIVDFNYDLCESTLLPFPKSFANKEAKSHREWVTTLKVELGREVSFSEVSSAIKKGFETVLQVEFDMADAITEAEKQILEGIQEKYHSESWVKYGKWSPIKDYWRPK